MEIAWISLNRPEKLNALNSEAWRELREALNLAMRAHAHTKQHQTKSLPLIGGDGRHRETKQKLRNPFFTYNFSSLITQPLTLIARQTLLPATATAL
jgi:1,4-dihydroxy-2-naphthoyl-CoA synthase